MPQNPDQSKVKISVEFKINDEGKKVKLTRKTIEKHVLVRKGVAERKGWEKFGACKNLKAGVDSDSTSIGEEVFLKLSSNPKDVDNDEVKVDPLKKALASGTTTIVCRICKGEHWTTKCPFKDTHQPINVIKSASADTTAKTDPAVGAGKYIPPSLRNRPGGPSAGSTMGGGSGGRDQDQSLTIRIYNLSEDVTDADVRDLVSRFGPVSRVFVAKHRDTNLCKGFAFITFYDMKSCEACIEKLNGYGYDSLILSVDWAKRD